MTAPCRDGRKQESCPGFNRQRRPPAPARPGRSPDDSGTVHGREGLGRRTSALEGGHARHVACWLERVMAKLEARFHPPDRREGTYIVVGHVTWPDPPGRSRPQVQPAPSLALVSAPATLLATLRHLVMAKAKSFGDLEALKNQYWSFVRIEPAVPRATPGGA